MTEQSEFVKTSRWNYDFNECVCGKRKYHTWSHARYDAKMLNRNKADSEHYTPYWQKHCRAIHVGAFKSAFKRTKEMIKEKRT